VGHHAPPVVRYRELDRAWVRREEAPLNRLARAFMDEYLRTEVDEGERKLN
jgi:hypothetical protein